LLPSNDILVEGITCVASEVRFEVLNLSNQFGCDSIVTIDIRYMGVDTQFVQATTCNPAQAGTVTQILPGMFCDTVRVTQTALLPSSQSLQAIRLCQASGPAADTLVLVNYLGCDSLAIRTYEYVDLRVDVDVLDVRCTGLSDGVIEIDYLDGGQPPLQYQLGTGGWQNSPRFENLSPGTYVVYVRENGGCTDTLSGLIVGEGLTLVLEAGPDHVVDPGAFIQLELFASLPLSQIQWSAVDFLSCPTCPATTLGPVRGTQTVLLTASTADGCNASDLLEVRMRPLPEVYIPNSFSPNFDGINDIFSVYGNEMVVSVRNLAIFDRWGNALYSRADLPINDPSAGWDGHFRDKQMDPGVYIYVVEVEYQDGRIQLFKGDVTLVK
jgi:gliding motility-associated-like protein